MYQIQNDKDTHNFTTFDALISYLEYNNQKDTCSIIIPWSSTEPIVKMFQKIEELVYTVMNIEHTDQGLVIQLL